MEEEAAVALTIPALVAERIATHANDIVLRKKDHGIWKATTWAQLGARVREVGAGLKAVGFRPGDVACVLAETRPEWVHIDLGILGAGGVSGGIHPEQEADPLGQALRDAACRVLFVENEEQLDKALLVRDRCPDLRRIVVIDMKGLRDFADPMCESLESFVGRTVNDGDWDAAIAAIANDQPAVLLLPRTGASRILTHGDALHLIANARSLLPLRAGDERLALLPMCHVVERVLGLYLSLDARVISNYLEDPDTGMENLQELQPTVLATDPQIWQVLHTRATNAAADATRVQRLLYRWAIAAGARGGPMAMMAQLCVLRAVRRDLGLSRLRCGYIGGAALPPEIERWAAALGVAIQHIDGQAARGPALDARYQALMQEAYGT
ncbi:MAG: AMP-binding protein [Acetobacteraceae bacterium]